MVSLGLGLAAIVATVAVGSVSRWNRLNESNSLSFVINEITLF